MIPADRLLGSFAVLGVSFYVLYRLKQAAANRRLVAVKRHVVITGSTQGIGLAMAKQHLARGDSVIISGRTQAKVEQVVAELQKQFPSSKVFGFACDVCKFEDVERLALFAKEKLGYVHLWVNNAGVSESPRQHIQNIPAEQILQVVQTNLIGAIFGTQVALKLMKENVDPAYPHLHHIFNMDGGGATGMPTPTFPVYGATKRALPQFMNSVVSSTKADKIKVGVHTISPGLVVTDMLLNYGHEVPNRTKIFFNYGAEFPSTTAKWLVERIRETSNCTGTYPKFLTAKGFAFRLLTIPFRPRYKLFDAQGNLKPDPMS